MDSIFTVNISTTPSGAATAGTPPAPVELEQLQPGTAQTPSAAISVPAGGGPAPADLGQLAAMASGTPQGGAAPAPVGLEQLAAMASGTPQGGAAPAPLSMAELEEAAGTSRPAGEPAPEGGGDAGGERQRRGKG